jgi:phospholipase A1
MRFFLPFLFFTCLIAQPIDEMVQKAQAYEESGEMEKALYWYKKAALEKIESKEDSLLEAIQESDGPLKESVEPIRRAQIYAAYLEPYENKASQETIFQMLSGTFGLRPYKSNYLLPFTFDAKASQGRQDIEAKFQLSLQKEIGHNLLGLDESYNVGYTQTSWWQVYDDSAPFRETNYEPEFFINIPYKVKSSPLKAIKIGILHESNGKNDPFSRSWNRIYTQAYFQIGDFFISPRIWYRFKEPRKKHPMDDNGDDNPDIHHYLGYGDLTVLYPWGSHLLQGTLTNNLSRNSNKGGINLEWSFPLWDKNLFGFLQYYYGYGESLIDYDKLTHRVGLGFSFSR